MPLHLLARNALKLVHRTLGPLLPPDLLARAYPEISEKVHVDDRMLRSDASADVRHYANTGPLAGRCIEDALAGAGRSLADVSRCLVLPCGYGRIVPAEGAALLRILGAALTAGGAYVEALMRHLLPRDASPILFAERGWNDHQDVWAYDRAAR